MSSSKLDYNFFRNFATNNHCYEKHRFEFLGSCEIKANISDLFSVVSNTSAINKLANFNKRFEKEVDGKLQIDTDILGRKTSWIEHPWIWDWGKYIISQRDHLQGFFLYEYSVIYLQPTSNDTYRFYFYYSADVKSLFMKYLLHFAMKSIFNKIQIAIKTLLNDKVDQRSGKQYLNMNQFYNRLESLGVDHKISKPLSELICFGDDDIVDKIKLPYYSEQWQIPKEELVESFLKLSKKNVLDLKWEVLCPHCNGSRFSTLKLSDLATNYSCEACDIDFKLDKTEMINCTFSINESVRKVEVFNYCAGEPYKKPHIKLNTLIGSNENYKTDFYNFEEGDYRLRITGEENYSIFKVKNLSPEKDLVWNNDIKLNNKCLGTNFSLTLQNSSSIERYFVLEKIEKIPFYLGPLEIFNAKNFRKLYSDQEFNKGIQLELPTQTIVFTDIVGSTKFYEEHGDLNAYKEVRRHFELVENIIESYSGTVIKTIGDAIMFTINNPSDFLTIITEIKNKLLKSSVDFNLRYSIHEGPVIGVNYNRGIDYFGETVNLCAKLQSAAESNEVALSESFYERNRGLIPANLSITKRKYLSDKNAFVIQL